MIYPNNFEEKIGFNNIRTSLHNFCLSNLGEEEVEAIEFSTDLNQITRQLRLITEMKQLLTESPDIPLRHFFDMRQVLFRLRLEGTHSDEKELFDIYRSIKTTHSIVKYLIKKETDEEYLYPSLAALVNEITDNSSQTVFINTLETVAKTICSIIDKNGLIRDNASKQLADIRDEKRRREKSITRTLYNILNAAQQEGLIDKDVTPTLRDSRLVLPIVPSLKRRIPGIVHDESASGRTVFVEPTEVVEANNRIRELEMEERKEIIRILTEFANDIRPNIEILLLSYILLAKIDCIYAKKQLAEQINGIAPVIKPYPHIDWIRAHHPLLESSLQRQGKRQVPLDITLTNDQHILVISGPNAGGKSVCLKTVGLLQYMLQCGLQIPVDECSTAGIFKNIMLDMGDEQSIDDDLSTYSSHLINMKQMVKVADKNTLLLIDEFGGGTEPTIGGAIAEALLKQYWGQKTWAVITTHYQNLKHFADSHNGIANAAMLYDRHEMKPLFLLEIGRPGSSFAIEIANKIGLPKVVIEDASKIVGEELINSDKYLQDIVRDKRYWENKRQTIHKREKEIEKTISKFENEVSNIESNRKAILAKAKEQAEELLKEANRRIENTIRDIKEQQAEKENTRKLREELDAFKNEIAVIDTQQTDEIIAKKIKQIQQRRERKEEKRRKRLQEKAEQEANSTKNGEDVIKTTNKTTSVSKETTTLSVGDFVRIKGLTSVGTIEKVEGNMCMVIFGDVRTKMRIERLEKTDKQDQPRYSSPTNVASQKVSRSTRAAIDQRLKQFKQEIDVRGMRGDEALTAVTYYIDDAILVGATEVRILHGTGNGILRQLIRQYLRTQPAIASFSDEHVQFGGAGITVVKFQI